MGKDKKNISIYCDGGARNNPGPAASAFIVFINNLQVYQEAKYIGETTNNVAEYSSVVMAFEWLIKNDSFKSKTNIDFYLDSELVVKQLKGIYRVKNDRMKILFSRVEKLRKKIKCNVNYVYIRRSENKLADELVNKVLDGKMI